MRCNVLFIFGLATALQAAESRCEPKPLTIPVQKFEAKGNSRIQALIRLGYENRICFGIEALDPELLELSTDLNLSGAAAQDVIRKILPASSDLRIGERDSVVTITRARPGNTWLDYTMKEFVTSTGSRQDLSNMLFMTFALQNDPTIKAFVGSYPSGQGALIGPFRETRKTVRQILDLLLIHGESGAWIAHGNTLQEKGVPKRPFWRILDYAMGPDALMDASKTLRSTTPR